MTKVTMKYEDAFYRTSDLNLAAALSLSYPVETIEWLDHRKAEFVFKRNSHLDRVVEAFWNGELQVEPQKFSNAVRALKARLYGRD